mmetsp:Transcript_7907/g.21993  ORF Transcript_7907/g.21993 Transcript_7907/m.21993 type:complete len:284 (+) Transcript_7907:174-1025(+)
MIAWALVFISTLAASANAFTATATASAPASHRTSAPPNTYPSPPPNCDFSAGEWEQRCELSVSYRIAHMEGWGMNIFNHITLKVKGSELLEDGPHFLLNDYGQGFDEVTASSLLKVTLDGSQVPHSQGRVFKPGYVLHAALHEGREDVHAIWHCHQLESTAICQTTTGLLPLSQEATFALAKGVSHHPYEGSVNSLDEQPRFLQSLGPKNKVGFSRFVCFVIKISSYLNWYIHTDLLSRSSGFDARRSRSFGCRVSTRGSILHNVVLNSSMPVSGPCDELRWW